MLNDADHLERNAAAKSAERVPVAIFANLDTLILQPALLGPISQSKRSQSPTNNSFAEYILAYETEHPKETFTSLARHDRSREEPRRSW